MQRLRWLCRLCASVVVRVTRAQLAELQRKGLAPKEAAVKRPGTGTAASAMPPAIIR
jgi:hypothetical protein